MNIHNVEPDISELHKGIFRASVKVPKRKKSLVSQEPASIPVMFSPSGLFRLKSVDISDGWDIEYVQVANVLIPAFRKSPPPLCTPAMRIVVLVSPCRFEKGNRVDADTDGKLMVIGEVFDNDNY